MKRRVLFVDHVSRILGGAEVNLVELLGSPGRRPDWEVAVACHPQGRLHEALGSADVTRHPFGFGDAVSTLRVVGRKFPLAGALRGLRALQRARADLSSLVAAVRPDAVVSCTNKDHFAAWPAARRAGIPSIWWVNDILSADFFSWAPRRAFCHQARRGANRLIVVSDFARRALLDQSLPPDRVVTIHNGIPLEHYEPKPRGTLRGMLNLADDEPLVGILGRFTPWKGQELFLRLAEAWCRTSARGQFALIGHAFNEDQAFEQQLREFTAIRGLRERIHFVPFQRDVAATLSDLDLLVHASLKPEPFGRVIIEAMAAGTPVLAARGGGVPEIIGHEQNGLLATPGDLADYLAQLQRALGSPSLRDRLRRAGRETVEARFGLDRVRTDFESLLSRPAQT